MAGQKTIRIYILKAFRFSENLADLFFLLLRHKFSSIAYVRLVNFNAEKRKKKEHKIRKPRCFEHISLMLIRIRQVISNPLLCLHLRVGPFLKFGHCME
jgi:hypothetical protein